jgi:Flp pilus assembly protein TadG
VGPRAIRGREGATTVELAVVAPLLAAFTVTLAGIVLLGSDYALVQGSAREGAREAALSGDPGRAVAAARAALPDDRAATVRIDHPGPGRVRVEVRLPARLVPATRLEITAAAVAAVEPGPPPSPEGPR